MPGLVYGPEDTSSVRTSLRNLLRGRLPAVPTGTAYCWAHVDDIADAHILAMDAAAAGQTYIIGGPQATLLEAMRLAATVAGKRAPVGVPPGGMRAMAPVSSLLGRVLPLPAEYTPEGLRVIAGPTYIGSNAKARRELGYDPRPLEVGWAETVRHEMATMG